MLEKERITLYRINIKFRPTDAGEYIFFLEKAKRDKVLLEICNCETRTIQINDLVIFTNSISYLVVDEAEDYKDAFEKNVESGLYRLVV